MEPAETPDAAKDRFVHPGSLIAIAAVERELAEMASANDAVSAGLQMRSARAGGRSMVYSIRLGRGEVEALERRAAANGLKPTVLARNLIRMGLAPADPRAKLRRSIGWAARSTMCARCSGADRRLPLTTC
jgi:hypothetical protein